MLVVEIVVLSVCFLLCLLSHILFVVVFVVLVLVVFVVYNAPDESETIQPTSRRYRVSRQNRLELGEQCHACRQSLQRHRCAADATDRHTQNSQTMLAVVRGKKASSTILTTSQIPPS